MLDYNEIKPKKYIVFNDEPYEVLDSHVFRKQQGKPVNQTKLRNLMNGKVIENSFHQSESVAEAEIEKQTIKYLYTNRGEYWFTEEGNLSNRFTLSPDLLGDQVKYIKPNDLIDLMTFGDKPVGLDIPIKVKLKVISAPPAIKGNTAQGGNKQVEIETGANIITPMFIEEGDIIEINTKTGEYTGRATN